MTTEMTTDGGIEDAIAAANLDGEAIAAAARAKLDRDVKKYTEMKRALADVKRWLESMRCFYAVLSHIDYSYDLGRAIAEQKVKLAELQKPETVLAKARDEAAAIVARAKDVEAAAQQKAQTVEANAVTNANAKATEIVAKAKALADEHEDKARQASHQAQAAVLAHKDAMAKVAEANAEHQRVLKIIAEARAKL